MDLAARQRERTLRTVLHINDVVAQGCIQGVLPLRMSRLLGSRGSFRGYPYPNIIGFNLVSGDPARTAATTNKWALIGVAQRVLLTYLCSVA